MARLATTVHLNDRRRKRTLAAHPASEESGASKPKRGGGGSVERMVLRFLKNLMLKNPSAILSVKTQKTISA